MIARVRTISLPTDRLVQTIDILRDDELSAHRAVPGFIGMIVLAGRSTTESDERRERIDIVTLWQDQQALDAHGTVVQMAESLEERDYEVSLVAGTAGGTVARYVAVELHPGHVDTIVTLFENVVMHAATEQRGFRRGLLLVDRDDHRAVSIGLWQSEADLLASERVGYLGQQISSAAPIVASPIIPETMTVMLED